MVKKDYGAGSITNKEERVFSCIDPWCRNEWLSAFVETIKILKKKVIEQIGIMEEN